MPASESGPLSSSKLSEICNNHEKSRVKFDLRSEPSDTFEIHKEPSNGSSIHHKSDSEVMGSRKFDCQNGTTDKQSNGASDIPSKSGDDGSEVGSNLSETYESCSKSNDLTETHSKSSEKSDTTVGFLEEAKKNKRFSVTRISKTKSINVDFRLSRGIAQVY